MNIKNFFILIILGFYLLSNNVFAATSYYSFKEGLNTRVFTEYSLGRQNTSRKKYSLDTTKKIVTITTHVLQNCTTNKECSYQELNPRLQNTQFCDAHKTYLLIGTDKTMSELTQERREELSFNFGITFEITNNTLKLVMPDGTIMNKYEIMQNPNDFVRDATLTVK